MAGSGIVLAIGGRKAASWSGLASFAVAVGLVVIYRRFVQKRPLWGKGAYRFPERGFGVEQYRERLKRAGIDPDQIGSQPFGASRRGRRMPASPAGVQPPLAATARPRTRRTISACSRSCTTRACSSDDEYNAARMRLLESLR